MTLALYARKKQWPLERVEVRLRHSKIHATDCDECETKDGKLDRIESDIVLTGALHRTLTSEINIRSRLV